MKAKIQLFCLLILCLGISSCALLHNYPDQPVFLAKVKTIEIRFIRARNCPPGECQSPNYELYRTELKGRLERTLTELGYSVKHGPDIATGLNPQRSLLYSMEGYRKHVEPKLKTLKIPDADAVLVFDILRYINPTPDSRMTSNRNGRTYASPLPASLGLQLFLFDVKQITTILSRRASAERAIEKQLIGSSYQYPKIINTYSWKYSETVAAMRLRTFYKLFDEFPEAEGGKGRPKSRPIYQHPLLKQ